MQLLDVCNCCEVERQKFCLKACGSEKTEEHGEVMENLNFTKYIYFFYFRIWQKLSLVIFTTDTDSIVHKKHICVLLKYIINVI